MLMERREIMDALIHHYGGRIANTAGDSVIAEFPSSVEAVRAALEIQESISTRNFGVPADRQVKFRIGINVGDIIQQGADLLGDGVNVAARLEALATPGGICLSGEVHDQIRGKLTLDFHSIGAKRLKNIDRRVRAYHVVHGDPMLQRPVRPVWQKWVIASTSLFSAFFVVLGAYNLAGRSALAPAATGVRLAVPADLEFAKHPSGSSEIVATGEFGGHTYQAILTWGGSWGDAEADAKRRGGRLVSITSEAENQFVFDLIRWDRRLWRMYQDGQAFGPWIGLHQPPGAPEPDGGWAWVGGEPVTFKKFSDGQPNNFGGNADVVRFHNYVHEPGPFWDDASTDASSAQGYVMELDPPTSTVAGR